MVIISKYLFFFVGGNNDCACQRETFISKFVMKHFYDVLVHYQKREEKISCHPVIPLISTLFQSIQNHSQIYQTLVK